MNARDVLASVTGFCDACGAGPGVVCDPFCLGVAAEQDEVGCVHCLRRIVAVDGLWVDPEASGDDDVWREVCDSHDTFVADHEPDVMP